MLINAKIVHGGGAHVLDCTIRDISVGGARITIQQRDMVPRKFYLLDMVNRTAYEAELVSERSGGFATRFLTTLPLAQVTAPELRYLKRIWLDSAR